MAKQNVFTLTNKHTCPATTGGTTKVDLPLSGYITHIDCLIKLNLSITAGTTLKEDIFARLIEALRIKSSGARNWVDFSDGRQWKYFAHFQYGGNLALDHVPYFNASSTVDFYALIPLHIGTFPQDEFDTSVVIPAVETTDLVMEIVWGNQTNMAASGVTIVPASSDIELTVHEIALAPGEKRSLIWKKGLVMPRFEPRIVTNSTAYSNLGLVHDLPVGDTLNRSLLMSLNTSSDTRGVRSDAILTEVGVKFPKLRETPWESKWRTQVMRSGRKYNLMPTIREVDKDTTDIDTRFALRNHVVGVTQIDGMQLSGRSIGLDLTRAVTGDAQYGFTTAATAQSLHILHYLLS